MAVALGAVAFCLTGCRAQQPPAGRSAPATPEHLVVDIRSVLPSGWSAEWDAKEHRIAVTRSEATVMEGGLNAGADGNPMTGQYRIALRVCELVTPAQYKQWAAENTGIETQLDEMREQMRGITHKFDSYLPTTPQEEQQVALYEAVKRKLHRLPDYHYRDISLDYASNDYRYPARPEVAEECTRAKRAVLGLLTKYEPGRPLDWEPWTWR